MKKTKVKVYIDGANMFYAQKKLGWLFDWKKIKKYLEKIYQAKEIRFYGSYKKGKKADLFFLKKIEELGFIVISKPLKLIEDEASGRLVPKANFDVEITRDILYEIIRGPKTLAGIVFFSGDSDFAPLAWDLKKKFKKIVLVYSSRKTLSWEMRLASSKFWYLEALKTLIFRKNFNLTNSRKSVIRKASSRRGS